MDTVLTNPGGTLREITISNIALGNSLFTVPAGKRWRVLSLVSDTTMTATVGNRTLVLRLYPVLSNAWIGTTSGNTAATQKCGYDVGFGSPINTPSTTVRRNLGNTANVNIMVRESTSCNMFAAGGTAIMIDAAGIDAADATSGFLTLMEYDV